jgi:hypothetical protein
LPDWKMPWIRLVTKDNSWLSSLCPGAVVVVEPVELAAALPVVVAVTALVELTGVLTATIEGSGLVELAGLVIEVCTGAGLGELTGAPPDDGAVTGLGELSGRLLEAVAGVPLAESVAVAAVAAIVWLLSWSPSVSWPFPPVR